MAREVVYATFLTLVGRAYFRAGIAQGKLRQERADLKPDGTPMNADALLNGLRRLLDRHGYLTSHLIDAEPSIPCSFFYGQRFGGLIRASGMIGYKGTRSAVMKAAFARRQDLGPAE